MEIKPITKEYLDDAISIIFDTYLEFEHVNYTDDPLEFLARLTKDEYDICNNSLGAFIDNKLIGVIVYKDYFIELLYIDKEYQRTGVGKALLSACMEQNKQEIYATSAAINAVDFYKKNGFVQMGDLVEANGYKFYSMRSKKR